MKILVLNGPNLNMLGIREPHIYGTETYDDLVSTIVKHCSEKGIDVECSQSNHEGDLVDMIQQAYFDKMDGIEMTGTPRDGRSIFIKFDVFGNFLKK